MQGFWKYSILTFLSGLKEGKLCNSRETLASNKFKVGPFQEPACKLICFLPFSGFFFRSCEQFHWMSNEITRLYYNDIYIKLESSTHVRLQKTISSNISLKTDKYRKGQVFGRIGLFLLVIAILSVFLQLK